MSNAAAMLAARATDAPEADDAQRLAV